MIAQKAVRVVTERFYEYSEYEYVMGDFLEEVTIAITPDDSGGNW